MPRHGRQGIGCPPLEVSPRAALRTAARPPRGAIGASRRWTHTSPWEPTTGAPTFGFGLTSRWWWGQVSLNKPRTNGEGGSPEPSSRTPHCGLGLTRLMTLQPRLAPVEEASTRPPLRITGGRTRVIKRSEPSGDTRAPGLPRYSSLPHPVLTPCQRGSSAGGDSPGARDAAARHYRRGVASRRTPPRQIPHPVLRFLWPYPHPARALRGPTRPSDSCHTALHGRRRAPHRRPHHGPHLHGQKRGPS